MALNSNTTRATLALALVVGLAPAAVQAEDFSGKTAAYIDWAAKNCEAKSSDHEHKLVEKANASDKAHGAFLVQYMAQFQTKEFSEALDDPKKRMAKCDSIKGWYGPAGTHISGLLIWAKAPQASSTGTAPAAAASARKGRRHGP